MGRQRRGAGCSRPHVETNSFFPFIEVVAYGDGRDQLAFINIDFDAVGNWAERRNLPYACYTDLAQNEVYQLIRNAWCQRRPSVDTLGCWLSARSATPGAAQRTGRRRRRADADQQGAASSPTTQPPIDALYSDKKSSSLKPW
jgi:hypothetical protein